MKNKNYTYPVLYTFRRCPYAIRARMALSYSQIKVELKEILLSNRPSELYAISIKGTVPVLCINNNTVIDESLDIMKWALMQNDSNSWISYKKRIQFDIIEENDNEFKYWLDRYKYFDRFPKNNRDYYRAKCSEYLTKLNKLLEYNQYLLTNKLLFVDVAIFPFIRQCANVDQYWFKVTYTKLDNWLNNIIESKLFVSVMDKYFEYNSTQEPLITDFNKL